MFRKAKSILYAQILLIPQINYISLYKKMRSIIKTNSITYNKKKSLIGDDKKYLL